MVHSTWRAPFCDGGEAVGDGQAQVVVAVDADDGLVDAADVLFEMGDGGGVLAGHGVADGVGDVDRGGAGLDDALDDLGEEVELGAGGVFGRELDVVADGLGALDALDGPADDLVLGHLELELAVDGAGGQEDVDARPGASRRAAQARSMSSALQRARPQMTGPWTWRAMAWTASKSPGEAMGKPASITSTPSSVRAWATSSFSARFMLAPGDCSPSRSVVSKMIRRSSAMIGDSKTPEKGKTPGRQVPGSFSRRRRCRLRSATRTPHQGGEASSGSGMVKVSIASSRGEGRRLFSKDYGCSLVAAGEDGNRNYKGNARPEKHLVRFGPVGYSSAVLRRRRGPGRLHRVSEDWPLCRRGIRFGGRLRGS